VGEVSECFQWKTCGEAAPGLPGFTSLEKEHLAEELSDVLIYLLLLR
jgi:NTP pyrophosphatase (non-canonical NTP hydrolase)